MSPTSTVSIISRWRGGCSIIQVFIFVAFLLALPSSSIQQGCRRETLSSRTSKVPMKPDSSLRITIGTPSWSYFVLQLMKNNTDKYKIIFQNDGKSIDITTLGVPYSSKPPEAELSSSLITYGKETTINFLKTPTGLVMGFISQELEDKIGIPGVILDDVDVMMVHTDGRFQMMVDLCGSGIKSTEAEVVTCPLLPQCPEVPSCPEVTPCPEMNSCKKDDSTLDITPCPEIVACPQETPCPDVTSTPEAIPCSESIVCSEPPPCPEQIACPIPTPCPDSIPCSSPIPCPEITCPEPPLCPVTVTCPTPTPCPEAIPCPNAVPCNAVSCPVPPPCPSPMPCPAPPPCLPPIPCPMSPIVKLRGIPILSTAKPCTVSNSAQKMAEDQWRNYVIYSLTGINVFLCLALFVALNVICRLRTRCEHFKESLQQYSRFQSQPPLDEIGNETQYNYPLGDSSGIYKTIPLVPKYKPRSEFSSFYG